MPTNSMRAALKALWKSTLGLSKADLLWCFDSFNTADGYFNRHDKRKNMVSVHRLGREQHRADGEACSAGR